MARGLGRRRSGGGFSMRAALAPALALVLSSCFLDGEDPPPAASPTPAGELTIEAVDVGGYELYLQCLGGGAPIVVLEAGLGASGTSGWFQFQEQFDGLTRTCTYDRAGLGLSDERPRRVGAPTGALMAQELHALLEGAGEPPPYVLVGHSYGGMVARLFAAAFPDEVAGMVLEDSSQEDEVDAYRKVPAGREPWLDGDARIDIEATEAALRDAPSLGELPLVVVTAGIYEDVLDPAFAMRMQERLARLSSNAVHVVAKRSGHFVHDHNPPLMAQAIAGVLEAARGGGLPPCRSTFVELGGRCLTG